MSRAKLRSNVGVVLQDTWVTANVGGPRSPAATGTHREGCTGQIQQLVVARAISGRRIE